MYRSETQPWRLNTIQNPWGEILSGHSLYWLLYWYAFCCDRISISVVPEQSVHQEVKEHTPNERAV